MSKVAQYLQDHLVGEVMTSPDAREFFSTDASILKIVPQIVVYPRSENDVRKAARFGWQLAERGRIVPITARGLGTDMAGGAIGSGVIMSFPAHMNKILSLNTRKKQVTIQPGINFGKLQQTLHTHGLFLPPYPASLEYSSVGGAIANNASGEKSIKYGTMREFVQSLRVVLANGEVITTRRLSKRELNQKMGLATFEGEIYRTLDALLQENQDLVNESILPVTKNSAGYDLSLVKDKKGTFDLTPLFVGSGGTLGIITEAVLDLEVYNPSTSLHVGYFDSIASAAQAITEISKLAPSAVELVDANMLKSVSEQHPNIIKNVLPAQPAKIILLIEFDDIATRLRRKKNRKAKKIITKYSFEYQQTSDEHEQEDFWKIRHAAATILWQTNQTKKALPIIEDAIVPLEKTVEFFERTYALFESIGVSVAIWGHGGNANFHVQPMLDISKLGDRQKIIKIMDAYYGMIFELGGSTNASHNDGRLRAPYLEQQYGQRVCTLFTKVKQIFDPYGTLNSGSKIGVSKQEVQNMMRQEYSLKHLYSHMPRT